MTAAIATNTAPAAVTNTPAPAIDSSPLAATIDPMPEVYDLISTEEWTDGVHTMTHTRTLSPEEGQFRLRQKELDLRGARFPRFAGQMRAMVSPPPPAFPSFAPPTVITQMVPVVVTNTVTLPAPPAKVITVTNTVIKTVPAPMPKAKPTPPPAPAKVAPKAKPAPVPAPTSNTNAPVQQAPAVSLQVNVFGNGNAVVSTNGTPYWMQPIFPSGSRARHQGKQHP